jgi:hypothetical protein
MDVVRCDDVSADGPDTTARVLDVLGPVLLGQPSLRGLVVDVVRADSPVRASRRIWPELGSFHAVVSRWHPSDGDAAGHDGGHDEPRAEPRRGAPPPFPAVPGITVVWTFAVTEHVGIERTRDWPDGAPTPGLKHVSLLAAAVPTPEFRASYRHHVGLVVEHLPLVWRYVQNDVERSTGERSGELAAISELSYRSDDDYARRWRYGAEGEAEFRSHEGFLDLPRTVTAICTEHVLRSPA